MILKRLELENIRSYKKVAIDFPLGKSLFEGDIGSGKSTLLMAIEFALFGLGSERGAALLRAGESEGRTSLIFDVNGREYGVSRRLVRKPNGVQQAAGVLETPEGPLDLSPREMKEKILEILNFNEPSDPKAQSVVYRYSVYTPQEEMKMILHRSPDERLETLRRAFKSEEYKIASENAGRLSSKMDERRKLFVELASDLSELRTRIEELRREAKDKRTELGSMQTVEATEETVLSALKREKEGLHVEEVKLVELTKEVTVLERDVQRTSKNLKDLQVDLESDESRIRQLEGSVAELEKSATPTARSKEELRKEISSLERRRDELRTSVDELNLKISNYESIAEKGWCPTCDRSAPRDHFIEEIEAKKHEYDTLSRQVVEYTSLLVETRSLLERRGRYDDGRARLKEKNDDLSRFVEKVSEKKSRLVDVKAEIEENRTLLEETKVAVEKYADLSVRISDLDKKIRRAEESLRGVRRKIDTGNANLEDLERQVNEKVVAVEKKQEQKLLADRLKEHQIWLDDYFIPTVEIIEKHVMLTLNQEFNIHFQKWFGMLVEDPEKDARVDEAFTPIIEQNDYEQDISSLSGGEKTSLALAYRLALNTVVKKVSSGMQSNLLILDEPTDGFSKEQLGRVREILDELQSPQIIIVSHERELESFADQIFRVTKVDGESRISVGV